MFASICTIFNKGKMYGGSDPIKNILEASRTHGLGIDIVKNFEKRTRSAFWQLSKPSRKNSYQLKARNPSRKKKGKEKSTRRGEMNKPKETSETDQRMRKDGCLLMLLGIPRAMDLVVQAMVKVGSHQGKTASKPMPKEKEKEGMKRAKKRTKAISQEKAI
jgi:hypothetical protein